MAIALPPEPWTVTTPVYTPGPRLPGATESWSCAGVVPLRGVAESQLPPESVTASKVNEPGSMSVVMGTVLDRSDWYELTEKIALLTMWLTNGAAVTVSASGKETGHS